MVKDMKNKFNIKKGFTLAEVLVSMMIVSVLFAATTKIITVKQKPKKAEVTHGYYECYYNGDFHQHQIYGPTETKDEVVPSPSPCKFYPPKSIPYTLVYYANSYEVLQTAQPLFNDDEIAFLPQNIKNILLKLKEGDSTVESDKATFASYLESTYPSSNIYQYYKSHGEFPTSVFISW